MLHLRRVSPSFSGLPFSCCRICLVEGVFFLLFFFSLIFFCDFRVVGVEVLKGTGKSEFKSFDPNAAQPLVGEVVAFLFGELE